MKVLVADDSSVARRLLERMLSQWGYETVACADGAEAWDVLQERDAPVLAIVDWNMPRVSGVELCRLLRQQAREPYVYVILLTANERKDGVVEGLNAGADDYLRKPFDQEELESRLRAGKRITDLHSELVAAREAQRAQAQRDSLTGLWNRGAVLEILRREFVRARREASSLAAFMVDLDNFKGINDTYGHVTGDAVLCEAVRRLVSSTRTYDSVGRYGGEEFLIVLPGCGREDGMMRADQLRLALASVPIDASGFMLTVTASVGVAVIEHGGGASSWEGLLKAADEALYKAKDAGRNRVEIA